MHSPSPKNEKALQPGWSRPFPQPHCPPVFWVVLPCIGWFHLPDALIVGWGVCPLTKPCMFLGFPRFSSHPSQTLSPRLSCPIHPVPYSSCALRPSSARWDCSAHPRPLPVLLKQPCDPWGLPCWCPHPRLTVLQCLMSIVCKHIS